MLLFLMNVKEEKSNTEILIEHRNKGYINIPYKEKIIISGRNTPNLILNNKEIIKNREITRRFNKDI